MKWKNILLVNVNFKTTGYDFYDSAFPPLALEYIAAYAEDIANVAILDAKAENLNLRNFYRRLQQLKPDMVGFTVPVTSAINLVLDYAQIAKRMGLTTIIGGWHPTLAVEKTLSSPWIDILVRGEGEITFRELIQKGTPVHVNGLSYKLEGKIIHNPDRPFIKDLNTLRPPSRNLVKHYDYKIFNLNCAAIETSRGCPQGCKFCSTHVVYNRTWRPRSVENIMSELIDISKIKKITDVFFVDDNFLVNMKRIKKLCEEIIKVKKEGFLRKNIYFFFQGRLDTMARNPEITKLMGKAGFWLVLVGVEAVDDLGLERVNKGCKIDQIRDGIKILHESGIVVMGNVIIGLNLDDNISDILRIIKKTNELTLDFPSFTLLTPFPATEFYEYMKNNDLLLTEDFSNYNWLTPIIKTSNLNPQLLRRLLFFGFYYVSFYGGSFKNKLALMNRVRKKRGITFVISPKIIHSGIKAYFKWRKVVLNNLDDLKPLLKKRWRYMEIAHNEEIIKTITHNLN